MRLVRWALACATALLLASPAAADPAGSATGGNAGSQSWLGGCKYNAVAPTLVSGQQVGLQCDVNGNLAVTGGGGGGGNVNLTGINSVTPLVGAGATGTGSLRTTTAQDTTTIAGSAPGTAGTASTNVVTVQGISGGVSQPVADSALLSAVNGATPAGTNIIGKVGIDQTTPGTTNASASQGIDNAGAYHTLKTDTLGGLQPGRALPTSTLVTTAASTSTQALAAATNRIGLSVQIETTLTANLYLCLNNQTCSATVHDAMIPSGATVGTLYTAPFGASLAVTYFTTQASASVTFSSWVAQ